MSNPLNLRLPAFLVVFTLISAATTVHARESPGFPPTLSAYADGATYELTFTGQAERTFLIFKVYDIAHYVETLGRLVISQDNVMTDGPAKAIMITFARELGQEQIRKEFDKSIRRNAQPEWLDEANTTIAAFMAAIDRDALEGDRLVFYWFEGGRVVAEFNGQRAFGATDAAFAMLIWSIWFGDKPACDRRELLALSTVSGAP